MSFRFGWRLPVVAGTLIATALFAGTSALAADPAAIARIEARASAVAQRLASVCPLAAPNDKAAFDRCRNALFGDPVVTAAMDDRIVWGGIQYPKAFKDWELTVFSTDMFRGLYLSLFGFTGRHTGKINQEGFYQVDFQARFRNGLAAGEYAYPFWHADPKWRGYELTTSFTVYFDVDTEKMAFAFRARELELAGPAQAPVTLPWDGKWMWVDINGQTQPVITLFEDMLSTGNPLIPALNVSYRELAEQMRQSTCMNCHVPNNPKHMNRLSLLQTPNHAFGEADRIVETMVKQRMPRDDANLPVAMEPAAMERFLVLARKFEGDVRAAREWEARNGKGPRN